MGGASTSSVVHDEQSSTTLFEGTLVVEGGGFASARYTAPFELPRGVEALALTYQPDERLGYKVTVRSAAAPEGVSYQFALPAAEGAAGFTTARMPLDAFRPTFRGRPAPEAPPLRAEDVRGLGLMLSRYEVAGGVKEALAPGRFRLALRRLATAESELARNGRRWVQPRAGRPAMGAPPPRVHQPYSRDEDAYLWRQRDDPAAAAAALGRGASSCELRLAKLRDPASAGHARLFGDDDDDDGGGGGGSGGGGGAPRARRRLRPVREVLERIAHDARLDAAAFRVGYADRFRHAPREVRLDAPNTHVAGRARTLVGALPEHRLEYVKYRKRLVWHKAQRG